MLFLDIRHTSSEDSWLLKICVLSQNGYDLNWVPFNIKYFRNENLPLLVCIYEDEQNMSIRMDSMRAGFLFWSLPCSQVLGQCLACGREQNTHRSVRLLNRSSCIWRLSQSEKEPKGGLGFYVPVSLLAPSPGPEMFTWLFQQAREPFFIRPSWW